MVVVGRSVVQSNIPSAFYESVDGAANRRSEADGRTDGDGRSCAIRSRGENGDCIASASSIAPPPRTATRDQTSVRGVLLTLAISVIYPQTQHVWFNFCYIVSYVSPTRWHNLVYIFFYELHLQERVLESSEPPLLFGRAGMDSCDYWLHSVQLGEGWTVSGRGFSQLHAN